MNQEQAIKLLIEAVELAAKRGCYSLHEARQVANAVDAFQQPAPEAPAPVNYQEQPTQTEK